MTTWIWTNRSCDGTHTHTYRSEKAALTAFTKWLGRDTDYGDPIVVGKAVYDDYGGRHFIEKREGNFVSAREEDALRRAYDARECGTATKRQLAMLDRHYF